MAEVILKNLKKAYDKSKTNVINGINLEIKDKKMEYDLVSIYKDESQAKEKLKEISDLINSLPQKTQDQKDKYQEVLNSFKEIINKVNKMETVVNPEILGEISFNPKKSTVHKELKIN